LRTQLLRVVSALVIKAREGGRKGGREGGREEESHTLVVLHLEDPAV